MPKYRNALEFRWWIEQALEKSRPREEEGGRTGSREPHRGGTQKRVDNEWKGKGNRSASRHVARYISSGGIGRLQSKHKGSRRHPSYTSHPSKEHRSEEIFDRSMTEAKDSLDKRNQQISPQGQVPQVGKSKVDIKGGTATRCMTGWGWGGWVGGQKYGKR